MAKQTKKEAAAAKQAARDNACRQRVYAAMAAYRASRRTAADWLKAMRVVCNRAGA